MIDFNNYKMTTADGAGVYVGTYKKYNEGSLFGMWIDLESVSDADEFFSVCRELHKDEPDPEFMFQDFQGFPKEFYYESMGSESIQRIIDYLQLSEDEREMLDAYCEVFGGDATDFDELLEKAKERNCGKWDSFRDFTDEMANEDIQCRSIGGVTDFFELYFDYEGYSRSMESDYYYEPESGYVFRSY